jgi:hypothetical protein
MSIAQYITTHTCESDRDLAFFHTTCMSGAKVDKLEHQKCIAQVFSWGSLKYLTIILVNVGRVRFLSLV